MTHSESADIIEEILRLNPRLGQKDHPAIEAMKVALTALRPVSREKVKKAEWIWSTGDVYSCSSCGEKTHVDECMESPIYNFCPFCMAPMTDEAVEMVMKRLEVPKDDQA